MTAPDLLLAGEIGKPHGMSGEVYVMAISDDPRRFRAGSRLLHADGRPLVVEAARRHRARLLVRFAGIEDREGAEGLRGALFVPAGEARPLEAGEYWPHELVGCDVTLADGAHVGSVARVEPGSAHDQLVVATPSGERLVPLVKEIVVDVRPDVRRIVIDPPAGLLA